MSEPRIVDKMFDGWRDIRIATAGLGLSARTVCIWRGVRGFTDTDLVARYADMVF